MSHVRSRETNKIIDDETEVTEHEFYRVFTPSKIVKVFEEIYIYPVNESVLRSNELLSSCAADKRSTQTK